MQSGTIQHTTTMREFAPTVPFEDIFSSMPDEAKGNLVKQLDGGLQVELYDEVDQFKFIRSYLIKFGSPAKIKAFNRTLDSTDQRLIRRMIRSGGTVSLSKEVEHEKSFERLIKCGCVHRESTSGDVIYVLPLEFCLNYPWHANERLDSLMLAMNRYPMNIVQKMASVLKLPIYKGPIHLLKTKVYSHVVSNISSLIESLSNIEYQWLKWIYFYGKEVDPYQLAHKIQGEDIYADINWGFWQKIRNYFFEERMYADKNKYKKYDDVFSLVSKGLLGFYYLRDHFNYIDSFFIPKEVLSCLTEKIEKELDHKREKYRQRLKVNPPKVVQSHEKNVLEDIVRVQIALTCGLVELLKSGDQIKRRSITHVSKILNRDELYIEYLLSNFNISYYFSDQECEDNRINLNTKGILIKIMSSEPLSITASIIDNLNQWMSKKYTIKYILHSKESVPILGRLNEENLNRVLKILFFLGLIEVSEDFEAIRITNLLKGGIKNTEDDSSKIRVLKGKDKPAIVQENLTILIPYNTHETVVGKISEFSEVRKIDKMIEFELTKPSLIRAIDHNWTHELVLNYLDKISSTNVPNMVKRFVSGIGEKEGEALIHDDHLLIRCNHFTLVSKILSIKSLNARPLEGTKDYVVIHGKQKEQVLQMLKKKNIFAKIVE